MKQIPCKNCICLAVCKAKVKDSKLANFIARCIPLYRFFIIESLISTDYKWKQFDDIFIKK